MVLNFSGLLSTLRLQQPPVQARLCLDSTSRPGRNGIAYGSTHRPNAFSCACSTLTSPACHPGPTKRTHSRLSRRRTSNAEAVSRALVSDVFQHSASVLTWCLAARGGVASKDRLLEHGRGFPSPPLHRRVRRPPADRVHGRPAAPVRHRRHEAQPPPSVTASRP